MKGQPVMKGHICGVPIVYHTQGQLNFSKQLFNY